MNNSDIQYQKLVRLMQDMNKRLEKIEAALEPPKPKTLHLPKRANNA